MPAPKEPGPITDLLDFYYRWPSLRSSIRDMSQDPNICEEDQETLRWLILLADRVGPSDLADPNG